MSDRNGEPGDGFDGIVDRLRSGLPEATPVELDRIKQRAMAQAARPARPRQKGFAMRRTLVTGFVTLSVMAGASGGVIAASSGGGTTDSQDAAKAQYGCPPNTHGKKCKPNKGSHCKNKGSHKSHPCVPGGPANSHGSHASHQ